MIFDWLTSQDVPKAFEIERLGYPPDEAANLSTLQFRQSVANKLFLGVYSSQGLIGFVCATLSPAESLTQESMSRHVPSASSVCIHSVCIAPPNRRQGIGLKLLEEYLERLERRTADGLATYERVLLITHKELRTFYEKAGFEYVGKSSVVHGPQPWYEMRRMITSRNPPSPSTPADMSSTLSSSRATTETPQQQLPPGIWEALQRPSSINQPAPRIFSSFPNGMSDVVTILDPAANTPMNKFDLLCPRSECGSIILKAGVAKWVERSSVQLERPEAPLHSLLPSLPTPPATMQWWLVTPSPMTFENIGFSRPIHAQDPLIGTGRKLKLLICAECDLGPLGWCEEGGSEFWVASSRVGYR